MTAIETRSDFYSKNDVTSIDVFKDTRHRATQVLNSTGLGSRIVTAPLIMTTHWDNVAGGYIPEKSQLFIAYQLPAIEHEIAHIVELNDINRLLKVDWGMESGFEFGAKQFFAAVTRETRVRAIQTYLFNDNKDRSVLSNPRWVESAKKYIPFGRYKTYKDFVIWHDDLFLKTLVAWSFDRIMHEWKSRADFIENWMGSVGLNNLHEGSFNKMKYAILNQSTFLNWQCGFTSPVFFKGMVDREPFEVDKVFKKHVYVKNPIHPSWRRMGNNLLIFFKSKEEALKAISLRVVL